MGNEKIVLKPIGSVPVDGTSISPSKDGELVWSINAPGRYEVVETKAPEGYKEVGKDGLVVAEFTVARDTLEITNILVGEKFFTDTKAKGFPKDGFVNITNKKEGQGEFEIKKIDMAGDLLKDAKFILEDLNTGLYIKNDGSSTRNLKDALTTSSEISIIKYEKLANGQYELKEYQAPDGYIKTRNIWKIEVVNGETTIKLDKDVESNWQDITNNVLTVKNRGNKINFVKVDKDDNKKTLAGAEFAVYREENYNQLEGEAYYTKYGDDLTSGDDGKITLKNLPMGHYKIYETKAPDGYFVEDELADDSIREIKGLPEGAKYVASFYVDINGYIKEENATTPYETVIEITKTINNTAEKGKFELIKVDSTNTPLQGAEFTLTNDKVNIVRNSTSEGKIYFDNLSQGTYTLEESKAPTGFVKTTKTWTVVVDNTGKVSITGKDSTDKPVTDINDLDSLKEMGYLIKDEISTESESSPATIKVLNIKPTYPATGGSGTFIGFALLGTGLMLTALAYFAIFQREKNRKYAKDYRK